MHRRRHSTDGYPEPGLFYQSLGFLDEKGNGIRYADFYHNGFPKPPLQGGGGGAAAGAADRAAVVVRAPVGRRAAAATTGDVLKAVPSASAFERTSPIVECAVGATEHRGLLQPAFALGDSMLAEDYEEVAFAHLCAADVACNASSSIGDLRCLRGRIQSFERMLNGGAFGESSWPQGSLEYDGSFE